MLQRTTSCDHFLLPSMATRTTTLLDRSAACAMLLLLLFAGAASAAQEHRTGIEAAMAQNARALGTQLVMRGDARGSRLLRNAAANGDIKAQYNLAVAYMKGAVHGVPQPRAALLWYAEAAKAGFAPAAYNAGVLYASQHIAGGTPLHATYWMCQAAMLHHPRARRWLDIHRNGLASCHPSD